jgi:hypothetical protein
MGYGIMPFSVSIARVQQAFGSRDKALADSLKQTFSHQLEQDAQDTDPDEDDDETPLTLEEALDEIIEGKGLRKTQGHKYGHALELLCWHFGTHLSNQSFCGMRWQWSDEVEEALTGAGVPTEVFSLQEHLMCRGAPVKIPAPDDFPSIGFLKRAEIGPALQAIESADFASLDLEQQEAAAEIKGWLETCIKAQTDLVCFY